VRTLHEAILPQLRDHFKAALLARMRVVPYYPVTGDVLHDLARLKLERLGQRLSLRSLAFSYTSELVEHMAERCAHDDSGARYVDQWIELHLLPQVVDRRLQAMARGEPVSQVHARLAANGVPTCEFSQ
jgi:type VI secretion system protein VasG